MFIPTESRFSSANKQELATVCKSQAASELLNILSDCKSVLLNALMPFLSGKLIDHQPVSVVHIISEGAPLFTGIDDYRYALCYIHSRNVTTPAHSQLIADIKLFCRLIRHYGIPNKNRHFRKLIRLLKAIFTFIERDRETPYDNNTYERKLTDALKRIIVHLCENVADDIQARQEQLVEYDQRGESAPPCPNPDKDAIPGGYVDFDTLPAPQPSQEKQLATIASDIQTIKEDQGVTLDKLAKLEKHKREDREPVFRLYRDLYWDKKIGNSFLKVADVTKYLLGDEPPDARYAQRIQDAKDMANRNPNGPVAFWSSIASHMRDELREKKPKKKRQPKAKPKPINAAPGPVPIPDRSWA